MLCSTSDKVQLTVIISAYKTSWNLREKKSLYIRKTNLGMDSLNISNHPSIVLFSFQPEMCLKASADMSPNATFCCLNA